MRQIRRTNLKFYGLTANFDVVGDVKNIKNLATMSKFMKDLRNLWLYFTLLLKCARSSAG